MKSGNWHTIIKGSKLWQLELDVESLSKILYVTAVWFYKVLGTGCFIEESFTILLKLAALWTTGSHILGLILCPLQSGWWGTIWAHCNWLFVLIILPFLQSLPLFYRSGPPQSLPNHSSFSSHLNENITCCCIRMKCSSIFLIFDFWFLLSIFLCLYMRSLSSDKHWCADVFLRYICRKKRLTKDWLNSPVLPRIVRKHPILHHHHAHASCSFCSRRHNILF